MLNMKDRPMKSRWAWCAVGAFVCACAVAPEAVAREKRSLSLDEAVAMAQQDSKAWAQFDARAETAQYQVEAVKANWWPKISVDASALFWSDASKLDIVDKDKIGTELGAAFDKVGGEVLNEHPLLGFLLQQYAPTIKNVAQTLSGPLMNALPSSMTLKEQFTFTFGAQIMMPLTPLLTTK